MADLKAYRTKNPLVKHLAEDHPGESWDSFKMKVTKTHKNPMYRQVTEGQMISKFKGDKVLNQKGEWGQNLPPKFSVESEGHNQVKTNTRSKTDAVKSKRGQEIQETQMDKGDTNNECNLPCSKKARVLGLNKGLSESIHKGQNGEANPNGLFSENPGLVSKQYTSERGAKGRRHGERISEYFIRGRSEGSEPKPELIHTQISQPNKEVMDQETCIKTPCSEEPGIVLNQNSVVQRCPEEDYCVSNQAVVETS